MIYVETNHGTGDTYMTLAFAKAVERVHGDSVTVTIPPHHGAIAAMFSDVAVYHDLMPNPGVYDKRIVCHPSAVPKRVRIDYLCLLARPLTHADLWRAMLDLPPDEPFRRGSCTHSEVKTGRVLLIPQARSIPNSAPEFWMILEHRLKEQGRDVVVNKGEWSLEKLFRECDEAEWVIGPQCGVMMILCHALFPCRKTIATPSLDDHHYFKQTYPYMRTYTFGGETYHDCDEVKIEGDFSVAVDQVLSGACAVLPRVDRGPGSGLSVPMSHGEFFDRLSVLELKYERLPRMERALVQQEYLRLAEAGTRMLRSDALLRVMYDKLKHINGLAWDANEVAVRAVMSGETSDVGKHYVDAVHLNKERVTVRAKISAHCGSLFGEVKSYYD